MLFSRAFPRATLFLKLGLDSPVPPYILTEGKTSQSWQWSAGERSGLAVVPRTLLLVTFLLRYGVRPTGF